MKRGPLMWDLNEANITDLMLVRFMSIHTIYSDNWLTHTVFCKLSLTRTRNPTDHLLAFLLRTLRTKCQLQNPGMFTWYAWSFIVSVITMISFALIRLWISSFPSVSPTPLMFHVSIRISFNSLGKRSTPCIREVNINPLDTCSNIVMWNIVCPLKRTMTSSSLDTIPDRRFWMPPTFDPGHGT